MEYLYEHVGIRFRRVRAPDLADLADLKNESWPSTHRVSLVSGRSQEAWLAALDSEDVHTPRNLVLVAVIGTDETLDIPAPLPRVAESVGVFKILNVCWQSRRADVGWDVYRLHRGKGLGKLLVKAGVAFCFDALGLHRLQANVLAGNEASRKCAEAVGFIREGYQRRCVFRGGGWIDNVVYGVLAEDWRGEE